MVGVDEKKKNKKSWIGRFFADPFDNIIKLLLVITFVVGLVYVIRGIYLFKTTGYYDVEIQDMSEYDYLYRKGFLPIAIGSFFLEILIATILNFVINFWKSLLGIIALVAMVICEGVLMGEFDFFEMPTFGMKTSDAEMVLPLICFIVPAIIIWWAYKGTEGMYYIVICGIALLINFLVLPLILFVINSPKEALSYLIGIVVAVVIFLFWAFTAGGYSESGGSRSSSGFGTGGYSGGSFGSSSKNNDKIDREIGRLKKQNADIEHGMRMHNKGTIGYGHVDNKYSANKIASNNAKIKNLEKNRK